MSDVKHSKINIKKESCIKHLEEAEAYILIAFTEKGMVIDRVIGNRSFTMLGGIELAKMHMLKEFESKTETEMALEP